MCDAYLCGFYDSIHGLLLKTERKTWDKADDTLNSSEFYSILF